MNRILTTALLAAMFGTASAPAQEPETTPPEPTEAESPGEAREELPDLDVWSEDAGSDDDVFVPTESISADASIAFPSDI